MEWPTWRKKSREEDGDGLVILSGNLLQASPGTLLNGTPKVNEDKRDPEKPGEGALRRR